jgi:hypothetical protein
MISGFSPGAMKIRREKKISKGNGRCRPAGGADVPRCFSASSRGWHRKIGGSSFSRKTNWRRFETTSIFLLVTKGLDILRDMKSLKAIGIEWNQSWPAAEFRQRYDEGEFK